jgi:hypothetical protein
MESVLKDLFLFSELNDTKQPAFKTLITLL